MQKSLYVNSELRHLPMDQSIKLSILVIRIDGFPCNVTKNSMPFVCLFEFNWLRSANVPSSSFRCSQRIQTNSSIVTYFKSCHVLFKNRSYNHISCHLLPISGMMTQQPCPYIYIYVSFVTCTCKLSARRRGDGVDIISFRLRDIRHNSETAPDTVLSVTYWASIRRLMIKCYVKQSNVF